MYVAETVAERNREHEGLKGGRVVIEETIPKNEA